MSAPELPGANDNDKKPQKRAVALHYKDAGELPSVVASGVDALAQRIIDLAEQHNIPIHEDETLANLLGKIDHGAPISRESYRLVAEVISFLYHMNQEWRSQHKGLAPLLDVPETKELPAPEGDTNSPAAKSPRTKTTRR